MVVALRINGKIATMWYPHYDSNVDLLLRTEVFYPLNYGDIPRLFYYKRDYSPRIKCSAEDL